jgi:hypothetical protein
MITFLMRYSRHFVVVFAAKECFFFFTKLSYSEMLKNHYKHVVPPTRPYFGRKGQSYLGLAVRRKLALCACAG